MPHFKTKDGCRIYYETEGFNSSGPVVVFLNGALQTTVYWKVQSTALKDRFRVLMYDARGQGKSDLGKQELSLECHANDLASLLKHMGIEKANLVGLSHGARVALAYAASSPESVDRLVLCSVSAEPTCRAILFVKSWFEILKDSGLKEMVRTSLPVVFGEKFLKEKKKILNTIVTAIVSRNNKEAVMAQLEAVFAYPLPSEIAKKISAPTLVISASDDLLVTEEGAKELAALCRGSYKKINGVGHSVAAEAPELFNKILMEFLCET